MDQGNLADIQTIYLVSAAFRAGLVSKIEPHYLLVHDKDHCNRFRGTMRLRPIQPSLGISHVLPLLALSSNSRAERSSISTLTPHCQHYGQLSTRN